MYIHTYGIWFLYTHYICIYIHGKNINIWQPPLLACRVPPLTLWVEVHNATSQLKNNLIVFAKTQMPWFSNVLIQLLGILPPDPPTCEWDDWSLSQVVLAVFVLVKTWNNPSVHHAWLGWLGVNTHGRILGICKTIGKAHQVLSICQLKSKIQNSGCGLLSVG